MWCQRCVALVGRVMASCHVAVVGRSTCWDIAQLVLAAAAAAAYLDGSKNFYSW
jgi:hypothetical protein